MDLITFPFIRPADGSVPWSALALGSAIFFVSNYFRNLALAGGLHWLTQLSRGASKRYPRIQPKEPSAEQQWRDFWISTRTFLIYSVAYAGTVLMHHLGWTRLYLDPAEYGWSYFAFSIAIALLIQDAYFYWTHRLQHWRPLMRHVHADHHITNPTPWTAFSMAPSQAVIESLIYPLLAMCLPMHPAAILVWLTIVNWTAASAHLTTELYGERFLGSRLGRALLTTTLHNLHHQRSRSNYGFFFTFWDRWMNTYEAAGGGAMRRTSRLRSAAQS
jgi:lathosterol oxidase